MTSSNYTNYLTPGSFSGLRGFLKNNKSCNKNIKTEILKNDVYTLHKPVRKKFKRCRFIINKIDDQWQCDLIDVKKLKGHNNNFKYIFTCIDSFSKYGWAIPILSKTAVNCKFALESIINTSKRKPHELYLDSGREFFGEFKKFCDQNEIKIFLTKSKLKASIVERFNRTLKEKLWRLFTYHKRLKKKFPQNYRNFLDKILISYNNSYHRSIKTKPVLVSKKNEEEIFKNLYGDQDVVIVFYFKIGDYVRKVVEKEIFSKGYEENWSKDIFIIRSIIPSNPPRYLIKELNGKKINGKFYREELQKVNNKEFPYDTFKIIKENKKSILIEKINSDSKRNLVKKDFLNI
jgi:hypothetical protein